MFGLNPAARVLFLAVVAGSALVVLWPAVPLLCRLLFAPAVVAYLGLVAFAAVRLTARLAARLSRCQREARRRERMLDLWGIDFHHR